MIAFVTFLMFLTALGWELDSSGGVKAYMVGKLPAGEHKWDHCGRVGSNSYILSSSYEHTFVNFVTREPGKTSRRVN